jgi:hypothetical protein
MFEGNSSRRGGPRPSRPVGDTGRLAGRNRDTDRGTYQNHRARTHEFTHAHPWTRKKETTGRRTREKEDGARDKKGGSEMSRVSEHKRWG